eukprot:264078_1
MLDSSVVIILLYLLLCTAQTGIKVPYSSSSPWNTPIASDVKIDPNSDHYLSLWDSDKPFRCTTNEYDETLYITNSSTITAQVHVTKRFSIVFNNNMNVSVKTDETVSVRIPSKSVGSPGSDSEIILWDIATNIETGFWQFKSTSSSNVYTAVDGYIYNTSWNGVPPKGFDSRGAGVPYMAGLLRKWEIEQGYIDHALALTSSSTSPKYIYPATKSDGKLSDGIPEGIRFQIDPKYNENDFKQWGLDSTGVIIAKCLQKYGMFVIDSTGGTGAKIIPEDDITADWGNLLSGSTVTPIPKSSIRAVITPH